MDILEGIIQSIIAILIWEFLRTRTGPNRHRWVCPYKNCRLKVTSTDKDFVEKFKQDHLMQSHPVEGLKE